MLGYVKKKYNIPTFFSIWSSTYSFKRLDRIAITPGKPLGKTHFCIDEADVKSVKHINVGEVFHQAGYGYSEMTEIRSINHFSLKSFIVSGSIIISVTRK